MINKYEQLLTSLDSRLLTSAEKIKILDDFVNSITSYKTTIELSNTDLSWIRSNAIRNFVQQSSISDEFGLDLSRTWSFCLSFFMFLKSNGLLVEDIAIIKKEKK